ncbi:hypothetical protein LLG46_12455 [bacterium]|nr:hypothetical protein [bacterium]
MSNDLESRVASLEKELEMLRKAVTSLSLDSVSGNLNVSYNMPAEEFILRVNDVGGDSKVEISGNAERVSVDLDDVGGDFELNCSASVESIHVSTEDVGGDLVCHSSGKASVTAGSVGGNVTQNE